MAGGVDVQACFSALQRAEIAEIRCVRCGKSTICCVSVLFNEPKLLKSVVYSRRYRTQFSFSALQRAEIAEMPRGLLSEAARRACFSALQRAEIAEIVPPSRTKITKTRFSALQRAEIAEIITVQPRRPTPVGFSALQRAEIAEITGTVLFLRDASHVSVLFNEPKLLKSTATSSARFSNYGFSALQRAEIAEITSKRLVPEVEAEFQCSSTSRNC